jgi:LuxR family maltose regulon positive regulatory protein
LLDRMRKQPMIWVCGPPGSGKTTLVSSYIEARKISCLWYQVDQGDADTATFFYYMGLAARKATPRKRKPLPLLTPEYLQGIPTFTQRYFENIYNRLKIPSVLVLDNYQEAPTESPFHEVILNGLSNIPQGINVILVSRSEPPSALIRLRANNLMNILGWDELRLTQEESGAILRLRSKQKLSKETIQHMHGTADGWTAGLVLMLESVKRGIQPHLLRKLTPEEIFDYFGNVVFDKTQQETQDFLLKTAFLPRMTAKIAEELTDISHAGRILSTLSRNNYFTEKRFDKEPLYQYHPLFRDFLLNRARQTLPPETLSMLQSRAALLLEEAGETEAAVLLFRDGAHWDRLIRLILKHASLMIAQGRSQTLIEWLNSIPREIFQNHPWLLYWMGACHVLFHPSVSLPCYESAFEQFKAQNHTDGIFLSWAGIVESIVCELDAFKPLDQWITVLEGLMQGFKGLPSKEVWAHVTSTMFIALALRQPHHPELERWERRALDSLQDHASSSYKSLTLGRVASYRIQRGDLEKARFLADALQQLAHSKDSSKALILSKHLEAYYHMSTGQHERCLEAMSEGLELAQNTGIHVFDNLLLSGGVWSALNVGDLAIAQELLEKMGSSSGASGRLDKHLYHTLRTCAALARGDLTQATLHAELALEASEGLGMPQAAFYSLLTNAHVMQQSGRDQEAEEHLARAMEIADRIGFETFKYNALLAEALFSHDQGKDELSITALRRALAIGQKGGYFYTFIPQPDGMAKLCIKALEAEIEIGHVQELIRRLNVTPERSPTHLENWPWPLKIFTLGRFEPIKDGKLLQFSGKVQKKPLSMLKALIALGGKEVRE